MRCAPLTRLALVLDAASADVVAHAQAAERAQLDLVTLTGGVRGVHEQVLAGTARVGVISTDPAGLAAPERSGLLPGPDGPQITPRSWVLAAEADLADDQPPLADLLFVRAGTEGPTRAQTDPIRDAGHPVRIFADVVLALGADGADRVGTVPGDLPVVTGTPMQVMRTLSRLKSAGGLDGFRLHLVDVALDLPGVVTGLVPMLRDHDAFRRGYETRTLRGHLELPPVTDAGTFRAAAPATGRG